MLAISTLESSFSCTFRLETWKHLSSAMLRICSVLREPVRKDDVDRDMEGGSGSMRDSCESSGIGKPCKLRSFQIGSRYCTVFFSG